MTKKEKEIIFLKYRYLIKKLALSFHFKTGIESAELISEGNMILVRCLDSYNPDKGSLGCWIKSCTINGLSTFCKKQYKHSFDRSDMEEFAGSDNDVLMTFLSHPDPVLNTIAHIIMEEFEAGGKIKETPGVKYHGWLDKKINQITGIAFNTIWKSYPIAKQILRGEI